MTLPQSYFDDIYATDSADPWGFTGNWYEERKRALTLALLPAATYATAYEPGCSIGVLTSELAGRCELLLATDTSAAAVRSAAERLAASPHVTVAQATLPGDWPDAAFDLVVLSELGYYFDSVDLAAVAARAMASGRTVLAVHWRHPVEDYPRGGDSVHAALEQAADAAGLGCLARYEDDDIVAAVWSRDPTSVAARNGLTGG